MQGIKDVGGNKKTTIIPSEPEAIDYVIREGQKGAFITICSDVVPDVLEMIMRHKEQEDNVEAWMWRINRPGW